MSTTQHTPVPLSFNYIYNSLHAWKNGCPVSKKELDQALQGNKEIHDQHRELLEALETFIEADKLGLTLLDMTFNGHFKMAEAAIAKAKGSQS